MEKKRGQIAVAVRLESPRAILFSSSPLIFFPLLSDVDQEFELPSIPYHLNARIIWSKGWLRSLLQIEGFLVAQWTWEMDGILRDQHFANVEWESVIKYAGRWEE